VEAVTSRVVAALCWLALNGAALAQSEESRARKQATSSGNEIIAILTWGGVVVLIGAACMYLWQKFSTLNERPASAATEEDFERQVLGGLGLGHLAPPPGAGTTQPFAVVPRRRVDTQAITAPVVAAEVVAAVASTKSAGVTVVSPPAPQVLQDPSIGRSVDRRSATEVLPILSDELISEAMGSGMAIMEPGEAGERVQSVLRRLRTFQPDIEESGRIGGLPQDGVSTANGEFPAWCITWQRRQQMAVIVLDVPPAVLIPTLLMRYQRIVIAGERSDVEPTIVEAAGPYFMRDVRL